MTVDHPEWALMCCICFSGLTVEQCAQDRHGTQWDVCKGRCALDAGIEER